MQPQKTKMNLYEQSALGWASRIDLWYVPTVTEVQMMANISDISITFNGGWKNMTGATRYAVEVYSLKQQ